MPEFSRTVTVSGFALATDMATVLTRLPGITVQEADYVFNRQGTLQVPVVRPSAAASILLQSTAVVWGNSAWVQMCAAASLAQHALVGLMCALANSDDYEIDIGTGGAGSEVVLTTIPVNVNAIAPWVYTPPEPLLIPAGARVAARVRAASGVAGHQISAKGIFVPRPL